jgi:hypothetical protein
MQTSASVDGSGKFTFTERIISGSNLFILTDANGNLTGSTSIPGGSFTNLTVTGALTASIISASNSITAAAATFAGPVTMSSTLSASGGIITSTISASSNVYVSGSLTVIGNIVGTIDSASVVSIAPINDGSTYYVTFVDSISGSRQLKTDADKVGFIEKLPSDKILTYYIQFESLSKYREKYITGILESEFSKIDFLCFDLESDGEKINEFAWKSRLGVKSESDFKKQEDGIAELVTLINSGSLICTK